MTNTPSNPKTAEEITRESFDRMENIGNPTYAFYQYTDLLSLVESAMAAGKAAAWYEGANAQRIELVKWYEPTSVERMYWPEPVNPYDTGIEKPHEQ